MFLLHILDCLTVNKQTIVSGGGIEGTSSGMWRRERYECFGGTYSLINTDDGRAW
jgi:hypothetical protein